MRSSVRATQALGDALAFRFSPSFVCRSCRQQAFRQHLALQQQSRSASSNNNIPFTEKVRRRIWGTDNPPGLVDPYGGPGFLERRRMTEEELDKLDERSWVEQHPSEGQVQEQRRLEVLAQTPELEDQTLPEESAEYVPAETWDGLEHMGHKGYWADMPPKPTDYFEPFAGNFLKPSSREHINGALHRAFVEVVTTHKDGLQLKTAQKWVGGCLEALDSIASANLVVDASSGVPQVQYATAVDEDIVTHQLRRVAQGTADENFNAEEEVVGEADDFALVDKKGRGNPLYPKDSKDIPFGDIRLEDRVTFFVLKRFIQLTGQHVPDPVLQRRRWSAIIDHMVKAITPKPKTLAEALMKKNTLAGLPNLKIMGRRETPVDKEKEVGRWKVIEEELTSRGLPLLGTGRD